MVPRETVFETLFQTGAALSWGAGRKFMTSSRRLKTPDNVAQQPALFQVSYKERPTQRTGMEQVRTWFAAWIIYLETGDPDLVLDSEINALLDAIDAVFGSDPDLPQTLGGLVHKVWVDGETEKFNGDLDGQAMIVVPLSILVP